MALPAGTDFPEMAWESDYEYLSDTELEQREPELDDDPAEEPEELGAPILPVSGTPTNTNILPTPPLTQSPARIPGTPPELTDDQRGLVETCVQQVRQLAREVQEGVRRILGPWAGPVNLPRSARAAMASVPRLPDLGAIGRLRVPREAAVSSRIDWRDSEARIQTRRAFRETIRARLDELRETYATDFDYVAAYWDSVVRFVCFSFLKISIYR